MDILKEIGEVVLALAIAWVAYQGLTIALGTPMPIVSVVSESMTPTLHVGDMLIVSKGDYQVGDIVIYQRTDVPYTIVHRIVAETDQGLVIKGDNNPEPDPGYVSREQILGEFRAALPLLGYPRIGLHIIGI